MWVFKNDAFVSAVEDRDLPDQLWVRARMRGDLERFFGWPDWLEVIETPSADYRFRCAVDRAIFKRALSEGVDGIDYDNFKNSIGKSWEEEERHCAYLQVWSAMMGLQRLILRDEAAWEAKKAAGPKKGKAKKKKGA